jgi:hypothetical protein
METRKVDVELLLHGHGCPDLTLLSQGEYRAAGEHPGAGRRGDPIGGGREPECDDGCRSGQHHCAEDLHQVPPPGLPVVPAVGTQKRQHRGFVLARGDRRA